MSETSLGARLMQQIEGLIPLRRSLLGSGTAETLEFIGQTLPGFEILEVPSGSVVGDWVVPDEWVCREAWVKDPSGNIVADWTLSALAVVQYSESVHAFVSREALLDRLFSVPELPDAVPYVTAYYRRTWGFCVSEDIKRSLPPGDYEVFIDAEFRPGKLLIGELYIQGESAREVLFSTNICHPEMANNELSGPVVLRAIGEDLLGLGRPNLSYRLLFLPETIGPIAYMAENSKRLAENVVAGWVLSCVGDNGPFNYIPSRRGDTLADRVSRHVLGRLTGYEVNFRSFLDRGSDERQWCSPRIDLPVASITRSLYGEYPEYHTSKDNLEFVSSFGLESSFDVYRQIIGILEGNMTYIATTLGEPFLTRHALYPSVNHHQSHAQPQLAFTNVLAYCDGRTDVIELAELLGLKCQDLFPVIKVLRDAGLLEISSAL